MARHFAAHQETGKGRHLPNFAIDLRRCIGDVEADIGADVEHCDFDRADVAFDTLDHCDHRVFIAGVSWVGLCLMSCTTDRLRQCLQRIGMARAAVDTRGEALGSKRFCNRAAGCVPCADNQCCGQS